MRNLSELKPVPSFQNEAEERDFWLTHDSVDYIDWSKAQQGRFEDLKRTPKEITRKIYLDYFLHKAARILLRAFSCLIDAKIYANFLFIKRFLIP